MSSLGSMWTNPITRNERQLPQAVNSSKKSPGSPPLRPSLEERRRQRFATRNPHNRTGGGRLAKGDAVKGGGGLTYGGWRPEYAHDQEPVTCTPEYLYSRGEYTRAPHCSQSSGYTRSRSTPYMMDYVRQTDLTVADRSPAGSSSRSSQGDETPPLLPILHSSSDSGSDDEGFGVTDCEVLRRIEILNRATQVRGGDKTSSMRRHRSIPSPSGPPRPASIGRIRSPNASSPPPILHEVKARPVSVPSSVMRPALSSFSSQDEDERRKLFNDSRLEATLGLIRSGQPFCEEEYIAVDYIKPGKHALAGGWPRGIGGHSSEPEHLRYALLLTSRALYMFEVQMLPRQARPRSTSRRPSTSRRQEIPRPNPYGSDLRPVSVVLRTSSGTNPALGSGGRPPKANIGSSGGGSGSAGSGPGFGGGGRAKIKSMEMIERLEAHALRRVSLPFKETVLSNGDVVARRSSGVVLHTMVGGHDGHLSLKCRSNQDRGALVEALVPWYESNLANGAELNVQQVAEPELNKELARVAGRGKGETLRRKDTDCIIS